MYFYDIKLQLGCLFIILYIVISYLRATSKGQIKCYKYFDALMLTIPWAVVFDGLTAWSVNHLTTIPDGVNRIFHLLFLLFMDMSLVISAMDVCDSIVGFTKKTKILFCIPGAVSLIMIVAWIGKLDFIKGHMTNYSMGYSAYVCFASVLLYYSSIIFMIIARHKYIPKDKKIGIISCMTITGAALIIQILFPEILISSLAATILMLGLYIDFENPSIKKLTQHNDRMVEGFATMVESRDNSTGGHIKRTRAYVDLILKKMRRDKRYAKILNKDYINCVSNAAPLHDIGKVATPDAILQKPGKLTDEEYAIMKEHAATGGDIIKNTFSNLDNPEFLQVAYEVARYHHERYNGKGYPEGLAGEEIPLHARIMAIADVFDAVSQNRCYRKAMDIDECFAIIENGIGKDCDPILAQLFLDAREEVTWLVNSN